MIQSLTTIKKSFLELGRKFISQGEDIFFPCFCLNCGKEGKDLCDDCFSLIDISNSQYCPFCYPPKIVLNGRTCPNCKKKKNLNGLFSATSYNNFIVKNLIHQFKYSPFYVKNLSKTLASLIIAHFQLLEKRQDFSKGILIPIPLEKRKLKQRGFNQAEEIAKELSIFLKLPLANNVLIKTRQTLAQAELSKEERKKNILGAFSINKNFSVKGEKIFLIDDVFTTGATMEEGSRVLKEAGAKEVWGIVVSRG